MAIRFSNKELQSWDKDSDPDILVELAERVQYRIENEGLENLNEHELFILILFKVYSEVNSGGFYGLFYNYAERAALAPKYLRFLGITELAAKVDAIIQAFGAEGPSNDQESLRRQIDQLPPEFENVCNEADEVYLRSENEFLEQLYAYCRKNLTLVRADWA